MNTPLWAHQRETIEKAQKQNSFALFWEPGTGKTRAMIEILKLKYDNNGIKKTLILCPLVVMKNWANEFEKYSVIDPSNICILRGSQENRCSEFTTSKARIFITNYESLTMEKLFKKFCLWTPDIMVLDECFVAGTFVDTPNGKKKIEEIKPGDFVINCTGVDEVLEVYKRTQNRAIKLTFSNKETITCSKHHPFFTNRGWVFAKELSLEDEFITTEQAMRMVQENFCAQETESYFLRQELRNEMVLEQTRVQGEPIISKNWEAPAVAQEKDATAQSDEKEKCSRESKPHIEGYGSQTKHPRWKWTGANKARENSIRSFRNTLGRFFCFFNWGNKGISESLQVGLSTSRQENSHRSRWAFPSMFKYKRERSEKGSIIKKIRLESISVLELGSGEQSSKNTFYDLRIKKHPSFSVNGLLVHNSHKIKSPGAQRTKKAVLLSDKVVYKYLLTGTPVTNSAMDLFSQFRVLDGGKLLGTNFMSFKLEYFYDENYSFRNQYHYFPSWKLKPDKVKVLRGKVDSISTSVKKKECLDLPPLQKIVREVPLSSAQRLVYDGLVQDFIAFVKRGEGVDVVSADLAITKALRLMQVTSGFYKEENDNEILFKENPKLLALQELIEEITNSNNKVLVWAVFHKNYEMIKQVCENLGVKYAECHGGIPESKKQDEIDAFCKDPEVMVYIGHPLSGGIGINLVQAAYSIYYSRNFSLEADIQSEARNYRGGSEIHQKITRIDLVCENTIEEKIRQALASKEALGESLIRNIVLGEK